MELSGLLDAAIARLVALCKRIGQAGLWVIIALAGGASAFLNNTPIVVLSAPVVRDVAKSLGQSPKRYLIPLSYAAVLGGCCTLIGTSTNLLVNDMASVAGQPRFGIFEITPVGLAVAFANPAGERHRQRKRGRPGRRPGRHGVGGHRTRGCRCLVGEWRAAAHAVHHQRHRLHNS